jgi:hypothetical protein
MYRTDIEKSLTISCYRHGHVVISYIGSDIHGFPHAEIYRARAIHPAGKKYGRDLYKERLSMHMLLKRMR